MALAKEALGELPPEREAHEGPRDGDAPGGPEHTDPRESGASTSLYPLRLGLGFAAAGPAGGGGAGQAGPSHLGVTRAGLTASALLPSGHGRGQLSPRGPRKQGATSAADELSALSPKDLLSRERARRGELGFSTHRLVERKRILMSVGSGIRVALTFDPENRRVYLNLPGVGENLRLCTLLRTQDPPMPALSPPKMVGVAMFLH